MPDAASAPAAQDTAAHQSIAPLIAEIRTGIEGLPAQVARDPMEARRRAVELYATRQEAIERGWGPGGSAGPDSVLAQSVLAAESSFHDLLTLLNRSTAPDSSEVRASVTALEAHLAKVERAAGASQ